MTREINIDFIDVICCVCGVAFAVPTCFHEEKVRSGARFFCPNGHGLRSTKNTVEQTPVPSTVIDGGKENCDA